MIYLDKLWRLLFIASLIFILAMNLLVIPLIVGTVSDININITIINILDIVYGIRTYEKIKYLDTKKIFNNKSILIKRWRSIYLVVLLIIFNNNVLIMPLLYEDYIIIESITYLILSSLTIAFSLRTYEKSKLNNKSFIRKIYDK